MGMAASQARLLSLTGRLHDVELKAQGIMSEKLALATQKDAIYQEYNEALEATSIKVAYWNDDASTRLVDANYNSLCNYNENRCQQYALRDNKTGKLIVSQEVMTAFNDYGNDKYAFAYSMVGFKKEDHNWDQNFPTSSQIGVGKAQDDFGIECEIGTGYSAYMTECEQVVYDKYCNSDPTLKEKYANISKAEDDFLRQDALDDFRSYLYLKYEKEIYAQVNINKNGVKGEDYSVSNPNLDWEDLKDEFNFYVNLWEAIDEAGGCQEVDTQYASGEEGNDWLQNMVEAGLLTILEFNKKGNDRVWTETSVATSTNNNYLQEVEADDAEIKKAEAKYNHELDLINSKDKKFDTELSKLETERSAITKEMDSIGKVRDENVERTFGIFS
ncbi:hypothetical protein IJD34_08145 [bacterium]|nr:hypothetical protein [bacterium]